MDNLIYQPLTTLIQGIRSKEITSTELVDACIRRIESVNPKLNAVVQFQPEQALASARKADQALARGRARLVFCTGYQ